MKKSFGQHFLKDKSIAEKIVQAAELSEGDFVVEVGPGDGVLTTQINKYISSDQLILIEADRDLISGLKRNFSSSKIIFQDAATVDYDKLTGERAWKLISNLPYNAGNAILQKVLASQNPPSLCVVMVQKEVGQRMTARPGQMSLLSVAVQLYTSPRRLFDVKPGSFLPPPAVTSSVLRLDLDEKCNNPEAVIKLAKVGFSSRRKQLHKNLSEAKIAPSDDIKKTLLNLGLSEKSRAQELSISNWVHLQSLL